MMKDTEKEFLQKIATHLTDAQAATQFLGVPLIGLIKEACKVYKLMREPLLKLNDEVDKRQSDRLFDLIQNAGLNSQDAVDLLLAEKRAAGDAIKQLAGIFNLNNISAAMNSALPLFMGMIDPKNPFDGIRMVVPDAPGHIEEEE